MMGVKLNMEVTKLFIKLIDGHSFKFARATVDENEHDLIVTSEGRDYIKTMTFRKHDIENWVYDQHEINHTGSR